MFACVQDRSPFHRRRRNPCRWPQSHPAHDPRRQRTSAFHGSQRPESDQFRRINSNRHLIGEPASFMRGGLFFCSNYNPLEGKPKKSSGYGTRVVWGTSVSGGVDYGGRRICKKKSKDEYKKETNII